MNAKHSTHASPLVCIALEVQLKSTGYEASCQGNFSYFIYQLLMITGSLHSVNRPVF